MESRERRLRPQKLKILSQKGFKTPVYLKDKGPAQTSRPDLNCPSLVLNASIHYSPFVCEITRSKPPRRKPPDTCTAPSWSRASRVNNLSPGSSSSSPTPPPPAPSPSTLIFLDAAPAGGHLGRRRGSGQGAKMQVWRPALTWKDGTKYHGLLHSRSEAPLARPYVAEKEVGGRGRGGLWRKRGGGAGGAASRG